MMRLLHFTESGDTSGYFPQLAKWHDRLRYQMFFGTLRPNSPSLDAFMAEVGVRCFTCGCSGRTSYAVGIYRLVHFLREERIDIIHTHLFDPSVVGLLAAALARVPVRVMTRHYSDYHTRIHKAWHVRLDQLCTHLAHRAIPVSQHTAEQMIAVEGAPPGKVATVLNGVDFSRFPTAAPPKSELRREFGAEDAYLLVVPARLHPEKGHSFLFRALPQLRRRVPAPVVVVLAGSGPFEPVYRQELASLGCSDMVRFAGFRRDLPSIIQAADLVVLPSVAEAFGLVLVETLFLGTPVVSTTAGGIPEIVDDGVDGILVPPGDSEALGRAIEQLLSDSVLRNHLAGAGRDKVLTRFQFSRMVRQYEALYEEVLGGRRSRLAENGA